MDRVGGGGFKKRKKISKEKENQELTHLCDRTMAFSGLSFAWNVWERGR